jgi:hypothetical protein
MPGRRITSKKPRSYRLSEDRLAAMIEEATVDAYGESEELTGWFTMIEDNLAVPFETTVLGVGVTVEAIDQDRDEQIIAICRRGGETQALPILDLSLPSPPPAGSEWIAAFRRWLGDE